MNKTTNARTFRLHVGIFGKRNAGKSSILNALTEQNTAIVSDVPGTTTDPVEKVMELRPLGPVTFIDTAGIDDDGELGKQRVDRTKKALELVDVAVIAGCGGWSEYEAAIADECRLRGVPVILVRNKCELGADLKSEKWPVDPAPLCISCKTGAGIDDLRLAVINSAPEDFVNRQAIMADLVPEGGFAVLVTPIDKEAPKGRLILPQVQSIRDLLDNNRGSIVVTAEMLPAALECMKRPPAIVVTDSQAFARVSAMTPESIPMTSFSILFARFQGDLATMVKGAETITALKPGDKVLIAEACTHHPVEDDIGTSKIPKLLNKKAGGDLVFGFSRGHDLPADLKSYKLVVNCGACVWNRRAMLGRIDTCIRAGVPITNYGMAIACSLGIFERALRPFRTADPGL